MADQDTVDSTFTSSLQPPDSAATSESGFDGHVDTPESRLNIAHASRPQLSPFRASSATRLATQATLGSTSQGLILYDLTNEFKKAYSPHCWKTLMGLKLLNIKYERKRLTFTQIRNDLARQTDDQAATVPTVELSDGTYLKDSWSIACLLAESHPQGHALFPSPSSKSYAAMLNTHGKNFLASHLAALVRPTIWQRLDPQSQHYFEYTKVGKTALDHFRNMPVEEREERIQACIDALEPIQAALAANLPSQRYSQLWLEAGPQPTHADFCIFGYYAYTRIDHVVTKKIWYAHPLVGKWIDECLAWAGDLNRDLS